MYSFSLAAEAVPRRSSGSTSILLAADDHYSALAAVRALRAAGYTPWLAVDKPGTYAARSRATAGTVMVPDPNLDGEGFVRELAAAARRLSASAILPTAETQLLTLAGREAEFAGVALGAPSRAKVAQITDKGRLSKLAEAAGLQTPPIAKVVREDSETASIFGFPAVLKPRRSRVRYPDGTVSGSARYVSACSVKQAIEALPDGECFVQQYIPGPLVSVSGVSWEGQLVCVLHQRSLRIWPMPMGVSSYAETIPRNAELEQGVGRLLRTVGWSGVFQAQFVRDTSGEHYLIDLNPRCYGSLALAVAAGLNLPAIWADLLLGRQLRVGGYRVGTQYRQEEKDLRALSWMMLEGEHGRALRGLLPHSGTTHAIFSIRDPMPVFTSVATLRQRLKRWVQ